MRVLRLADELAQATAISPETAHRRLAEGQAYEAGVIRLAPGAATDPRQVTHADRDVLCYVLSGAGRLRAAGDETPLRPGLFCHIPANTPHDFAATTEPLSLYYCLIRTRPA
jgi:mannose-6-phosphate isomerase-like protein (cupin superfamily)